MVVVATQSVTLWQPRQATTGQRREQTGAAGVGRLGEPDAVPEGWGGPREAEVPCRPLPPPAAEDGQQGARGHGATAWGGVSPVLTGAEHSAARGVEPSPVDAGAVPGGHAHVVLGPKPPPSPSNLSPVGPPPQTPCTRLPHTSVPSHACRCGGARTPNLWEKKTVPTC